MSLKIVDEYRTVKAVVVRSGICPRCSARIRKQRTFSIGHGRHVMKPRPWRKPGAGYLEDRGLTRAEAAQWVDSLAAAWHPPHGSFTHDRCH